MNKIPGHMSPPYSDAARDDALFHYTSADGLIGIFESRGIWSTAYYCTNDEMELATGRGILTPEFRRATYKMIKENEPLVTLFNRRGVDILEYANKFENTIIGHAFGVLCAFITCFCKPINAEDFRHGLLSQWRAYGSDGGYALQFSRKKLVAAVEKANKDSQVSYDLQDVYYTVDNPFKVEVLKHTDSFLQVYREYLESVGKMVGDLSYLKGLIDGTWSLPNPNASLLHGPLESLLDYLIYTKSQHFSEEKECRLSLVEAVSSNVQGLPTEFLNRSGLVVPYKQTPSETFPILDCIEWIVIGPNPRMDARFKSVSQMVRAKGLAIKVRPSGIPFARS